MRPTQLLTTDIVEMLPAGYSLADEDVIWINYVHLVCIGMLKDKSAKKMSYGEIVKAAIERLTIDKGIRHPDPYELRIDAGVFDTELNEGKMQNDQSGKNC